jgi:hypothetical protein
MRLSAPGDDTFATTPVQASQCVLSAHALGQTQAVADEMSKGFVWPETQTSLGLAAHCLVDDCGHQCSALLAVFQENCLVPVKVPLIALEPLSQRLESWMRDLYSLSFRVEHRIGAARTELGQDVAKFLG